MRLWHYELIPYLPKSQLLAQWRELNSIYKHHTRHILINYVYDYDKSYLYEYSSLVISEMKLRGCKINKWDNYNKYFCDCLNGNNLATNYKKHFEEHTKEYLTICFYNLKEKYNCGQKDFTSDMWDNLEKFYCRTRQKQTNLPR